jgi:DNA-binding CsgD family transcriptional regulator
MDVIANARMAGAVKPADLEATLASGLSLLVDEIAHGALVVTAEGRLLHANRAARRELERARVLGTRQHQLQACTGQGDRVLKEAFAKAALGKRSLIEMDATSGPRLAVAVMPLKTPAPDGPQIVGLLFARGTVCDPLMLCFFARSCGLTPAEEQVLGILCEGHSAPEIAGQLKVAVSTVRSHIRSLCAKTRSNGVRELVSRIAMLPPVAPPRPEAIH